MSPYIKDFRTTQFLGFIIGGIIIVVVGMLDDVYELGPKFKLFIQFVVSVIVVFTGTKIDVIMWPFWQYLKFLSTPITIIWIIGLINAVNLIDGLDGLAAGVTSIASICLMVLCILSGSTVAVALTAALAGSCLGFLPRNFSPAEIYMGDTGSTFLGYVLAVTSCIGVFKSYAILSIVLAILAMALPILDTLFAMIRRAINHKPIMGADRGHLHHRLIDAGYTNKQAVMILYALSLTSAVVAVLIAMKDVRATIIVFFFLMILLLMMFAYRKRTK
jgi:UDP-GlcNAc:undecaprenyl-phosphate GlcNAc-1-phosphate transferase